MVNSLETNYKSTESQDINDAYDLSTYGDANPDYIAIAIADKIKHYDNGVFIAAYEYQKVERDEILDPTQNNSIGSGTCNFMNLCVPAIHVPSATSGLGNATDTSNAQAAADDINNLADGLSNLNNYSTPAYLSHTDLTHNFTVPDRPDLTTAYNNSRTDSTIPLTTQDSVPCRPETPAVIPDYDPEDLSDNPELNDMLDRLEDLLKEDTSVPEQVSPVDNSKLTERTIDGHGTFDWLSTALMNQVRKAVDTGLINKAEARDVYATGLQQTLQTSASFLLENEKAYWANLLTKNQIEMAKIQALLTKAELIMLPTKVRLAYAELEAKLKQIDLLRYQVEIEKQKIPKIVAEVDQIREQTALICQQKKQAIEELAQAELNRELKQEQIDLAKTQNQHEWLKLDITREQVVQNQQQTLQLIASTEQTVEQSKLINAQMQGALKDIKIKDAQIIKMKAELKLQAQKLLQERERIALLKAQTASAYANIGTLTEQLKAAKAQYSDTIDGAPIGGVIGAQIKVNKAQAMGFERDSFYKFFSLIQSGWSAKKTSDIATLSPNAFTALGLDRVINWYSTKYFNMPNDTFELPDNYRDYLTDDEMDGVDSTPNTVGSTATGTGNNTGGGSGTNPTTTTVVSTIQMDLQNGNGTVTRDLNGSPATVTYDNGTTFTIDTDGSWTLVTSSAHTAIWISTITVTKQDTTTGAVTNSQLTLNGYGPNMTTTGSI